jgi:hypothetical protein
VSDTASRVGPGGMSWVTLVFHSADSVLVSRPGCRGLAVVYLSPAANGRTLSFPLTNESRVNARGESS